MSGQAFHNGFHPLPGGAQQMVGQQGGIRHPDWLGSTRLDTNAAGAFINSGAYAPFGEGYVPSPGGADLQFTSGSLGELTISSSGAHGLYDFDFRKYSPLQGRWISPDPAGLAAVNPGNPQSWNRYAYVGNSPLDSVDPLGLDDCFFGDDCYPGPGYCDPFDPYCGDCFENPWECGYPGGGGGGGGSPGPIAGPAPTRKGGVWPDNETLGFPKGLNLGPATLLDLLGLSPGTQCDFGVCGNGILTGVTGIGTADSPWVYHVLVLAKSWAEMWVLSSRGLSHYNALWYTGALRHWYFYNLGSGQSVGLGPDGWEPPESGPGHIVFTPTDAQSACIDIKLANKGIPPAYYWAQFRSTAPALNCRGYCTRVLHSCGL